MQSVPARIAALLAIAALCIVGCRPGTADTAQHDEDTTPSVPAWESSPVVLPQGTVLRCAVAQDVPVRTARVGDVVTLIATEKLVLDGVEVVLPGTHLQARVSGVRRGRGRLQSPELTLDTVSIESPTGLLRDCPARTIHVKLESDHHGLAAGTLLDVFVSAPIEMPAADGV